MFCWAVAAIGSASASNEAKSADPNDLQAGIFILLDELNEARRPQRTGHRQRNSRSFLIAGSGVSAFRICSIHLQNHRHKEELFSSAPAMVRLWQARQPLRGGGASLPSSLRIGLFDVVREIGGPEAQQLLVEAANVTGRAAALTVLNRLLDELLPSTYGDVAVAANKRLFGGWKLTNRGDRDSIYAIPNRYGDTTFVSTARAQWVQPDGTVDQSARRYVKRDQVLDAAFREAAKHLAGKLKLAGVPVLASRPRG
jgi:hypothetical protein